MDVDKLAEIFTPIGLDPISLISPALFTGSFIVLAFIIAAAAQNIIKRNTGQTMAVRAVAGLAILIALYVYAYVIFPGDTLKTIFLALLGLPTVLLIPGYVLYHVLSNEDSCPGRFERLFFQVLGSILVSGWVSLTLAELGLFSFWTLVALLLAASLTLAIVFKVPFPRVEMPNIKIGPAQWALIIIIFVTVALYFHPFPWIVGGRDPGVYVNTGIDIAKTGGITLHDSVLSDMDSSTVTSFFYGHQLENNRGSQFPGFYITDYATGEITPQFFYLWPSWIAIAYSIFSLDVGLYVISFFGLLSVLSVYLAGKKLFNERTGLIAALLLALNFAALWFSREPTTEIFTLFLIINGVTALVLFDRTSSRYYAALAGLCFGETFLTRIDTIYLLAPIGLFLLYQWYADKIGWRHLYFVVPLALAGINGVADAVLISYPYTNDIFGNTFSSLFASLQSKYLVIAPGIVALVAALWLTHKHKSRIATMLKGRSRYGTLVQHAAVLVLAVCMFYAYFIRPQGDVLGDSYNLVKLSWYFGGIAGILIVFFGCALLFYRKPYHESYFFLSILLVFAVPYVLSSMISADQPFWVRRYLPVVIPMALLCVAYLVSRVSEIKRSPVGGKYGPWVIAAVLVLAITAPAVAADLKVASFTQYGDALDDVRNLAGMIDDDGIVLYHTNYYSEKVATPLYYIYDKEIMTARISDASVNEIYQIAAGNRSVYLVDILHSGDITGDVPGLRHYSVNWPFLFDLGDYTCYFYMPMSIEDQSHDFSIYEINDTAALDDIMILSNNWYGLELWDGVPTQWQSNNGSVYVFSSEDRNATLSFSASSFYRARTLRVYVNGELIGQHSIPPGFTSVSEPVRLQKGPNSITFYSVEGKDSPASIPQLHNQDPRSFSFAFRDIRVS
jgi:hypothetical protein